MARRVTFWSAGALAAVAGALAIATLVWPSTTNAVPCIPDPCPSGQPYTTPMVWGFGSTCSAAQSDAVSQARSHARSDCGGIKLLCNFQFVTTASCWWNNSKGMYQVDGFAKYNCTDCSPFVP